MTKGRFDISEYRERISRDGFATVPGVVDGTAVDVLRRALGRLGSGEEVRRRGGTYGVRNLFHMVPEVCQLASSPSLRALVEPILGTRSFAVRGTLFDKIPEANWKVGWHQDSVISVHERREVSGFGPWAEKAGVLQVEPPAAVLERMLALRIHLDECGRENGPMRVLPGSHAHGWLDDDIARWKSEVSRSSARCLSAAFLPYGP